MIDRQLLQRCHRLCGNAGHNGQQKLAQVPGVTPEQAKATLPAPLQQQATLPELAELAKQQTGTARWQYGNTPWAQNTAVGVGGAGIGAGIGGLLGGKQALLPGALIGGFIALIARFFFKNQFDQAFSWMNQTMQRPDAANVFAKVRQQISTADRKAAAFLQNFDPNQVPMQLDAYKKELETHSKVTNERLRVLNKGLTDVQKQLSDVKLPKEQRDALTQQQTQLQAEVNKFNTQIQGLAAMRSRLETQEQAAGQAAGMGVPQAAQQAGMAVAGAAMPGMAGAGMVPATQVAAGQPQPQAQPKPEAPKAEPKKSSTEKESAEQTLNLAAPTTQERAVFRQNAAQQRAGNYPTLKGPLPTSSSHAVDQATNAVKSNVNKVLQPLQTAAAIPGKIDAGINKFQQGWNQYKQPLAMMAMLPMLTSMLSMFGQYGQSSQLANIAQALQQRGSALPANPYMNVQNPYMAGAFRREF